MRPATKFVVPCTALAVLLSPLGFAATTAISPGYEAVTRVVKFDDLDLTKAKAVVTLYGRIKSAAGEVCKPSGSRAFDSVLRVRRCTKRAIDQAVGDVNSPGLTSLHEADTNENMAASNQTDFP
jgi:UrcA family protein